MEVLEALLRGLCKLHGWNYHQIRAMVRGKRPVTPEVVRIFEAAFQVPPSAWPYRAPVVSAEHSRYIAEVTTKERKAILRENGRKRRVLSTPVHEVLDVLDWSIADLTAHVSAALGQKISRASMQFWATGTRQVGPKGQSRSHAVQAPLEVRIAAEKVTARFAQRRRLGESAVLERDKWPNVETE